MQSSTSLTDITTICDSTTASTNGPSSLTFNLTCRSCFSHFLQSQGSTPRLLQRDYPTPIHTFVPINLVEPEGTRQILDLSILDWPLPYHERMRFINSVMEITEETLRSMPTRNNTVHIHAVVNLSYETTYDTMIVLDDTENQVIQLLAQLSMQDSSYGMIPATESAIESLEKKKYTSCNDTTDDCSICLEEFSVECDVTSMSCCHVFHWDCIKKWLGTSRYCPVCRFEMPTREV